jgi:hypothetical protein
MDISPTKIAGTKVGVTLSTLSGTVRYLSGEFRLPMGRRQAGFRSESPRGTRRHYPSH